MIGARQVEICVHLVCKVDGLPDMIGTGSKSDPSPLKAKTKQTELRHY